jgi:hypothetical protein
MYTVEQGYPQCNFSAKAQLRKNYLKVKAAMGLILIMAMILDPFCKHQTFEAGDMEIEIQNK